MLLASAQQPHLFKVIECRQCYQKVNNAFQLNFCFQSTLKHLDLAGNRITTISDSQLNQIQSLVVLNLANNHITIIDNQAFCCVPNLLWLSLASNPLQRINPDTFLGVRSQLESLNVANTSLTLLPSFQLPSLKELDISYNQVKFL